LDVEDVLKQVTPSEPAFFNSSDDEYLSRIVVDITGISPG
jgi:hypothetical protein